MKYIFYSFYCLTTLLVQRPTKDAQANAWICFSLTGAIYTLTLAFYSGLLKLLFGTSLNAALYSIALFWFGGSYLYFLKAGKGIEIVEYYSSIRENKKKWDALFLVLLLFSGLILFMALYYFSNKYNYKPYLNEKV